MILIDSDVIVDVIGRDAKWRDWSLNALQQAAKVAPLAVNPVIYGEAAVGWRDEAAFAEAMADFRMLPITQAVAWRAAQALTSHLSRRGPTWLVLNDFLVGAHAEVERHALLTRRPKAHARFQIPEVISP